MLGSFIARAVADDCLAPAYVSNHSNGSDKAKSALQLFGSDLIGVSSTVLSRVAVKRAEVLLKMKHGMVRLDAVWGSGGGRRPVKVLVNKVRMAMSLYSFSFLLGPCLEYLNAIPGCLVGFWDIHFSLA